MSLQPLRNRRSTHQKKGRYLSSFLFLAALVLIILLAQFQWVGYIIILGYVVTAVIKGMSSRSVFVLALVMLGAVPLAILFSNWTAAQNFAAYFFVLLVTGVVFTTLELRREPVSNE